MGVQGKSQIRVAVVDEERRFGPVRKASSDRSAARGGFVPKDRHLGPAFDAHQALDASRDAQGLRCVGSADLPRHFGTRQ